MNSPPRSKPIPIQVPVKVTVTPDELTGEGKGIFERIVEIIVGGFYVIYTFIRSLSGIFSNLSSIGALVNLLLLAATVLVVFTIMYLYSIMYPEEEVEEASTSTNEPFKVRCKI